jgi:hypothetical protein
VVKTDGLQHVKGGSADSLMGCSCECEIMALVISLRDDHAFKRLNDHVVLAPCMISTDVLVPE